MKRRTREHLFGLYVCLLLAGVIACAVAPAEKEKIECHMKGMSVECVF